MKKLNFEIIEFDHNIFVSKDKKIFIAIYINNLLIIYVNIIYINVIKVKLEARFQIINLRLAQYYLSIEITRNDNIIILRQIIYLKKIFERFDINKCKIVSLSIKLNLVVVIMLAKKEHTIYIDTIQ